MKINIDTLNLEDINLIQTDFLEKFDNFWSIDILKNDIKDEHSKYIVAKIDNEIVGFAGIKIVIDEAEIMNIVTKVDNRNIGIGSLLLEKLIDISNSSNCTVIHLEVNEKNDSAIHLYEKYNFKRIGFRKRYYNNTDNAILMKKDLNK